VIAGYFGSGAAGHPNQAYLISPPYTSFKPANVPGSVQTQVQGINGNTYSGCFSGTDMGIGQDANYGFIATAKNGKIQYLLVDDLSGSVPGTAQVLGINASQIAAGFYTDANGVAHGFSYTVSNSAYTSIGIAGSTQVFATGINNSNLVCGYFVAARGNQVAFLKPMTGGTAIHFAVPGALVTQFLGVNSAGEAVGFYPMSSTGITHGRLYNPANGEWVTLDNPNGVGGTVLNGLNNKGQVVGFYTDAAGNVDGMLVNNAF
jgi:hypothetical protein